MYSIGYLLWEDGHYQSKTSSEYLNLSAILECFVKYTSHAGPIRIQASPSVPEPNRTTVIPGSQLDS